jgi:hypothetical protein
LHGRNESRERSAGRDCGSEARQLGLNVAKLLCQNLTSFVRIVTVYLQFLYCFLESPGNDIGIDHVLLDGPEHGAIDERDGE